MESEKNSLSPIFHEDPLSVCIRVPKDRVERIVDKNENILEALKKRWIVNLEILNDNNESFITVTGYQEYGLDLACDWIRYLCTDEALEVFRIPNWLASLVIGPKQSVLQMIERTCDVSIKAPNRLRKKRKRRRKRMYEENAEFEIFGVPTNRARARAKMRETCSTYLNAMQIEDDLWDEQLVDNYGNEQARSEDAEQTMAVELVEEIFVENHVANSNTNFSDDPHTQQNTTEILHIKFDNEKDLGFFVSSHKPNIENRWNVNLLCKDFEVKITSGTGDVRRAAYDEVLQRKVLIAMMRNYSNAKALSKKDPASKEKIMNDNQAERIMMCYKNQIMCKKFDIKEHGALYIGSNGSTIQKIQRDGGTWIISNLENDKGYLEIYGNEANIKKTIGFLNEVRPGFKQKADKHDQSRSMHIGKKADHRHIQVDELNCSFENLFRNCARKPTREITIEEPELKNHFVRDNLDKFCQAMRRLFPNVKLKINLKTHATTPTEELYKIRRSLSAKSVELVLNLTTEHVERLINFHNGCIVYLNNGLDLYKRVAGRFEDRKLNEVPCRGGTLIYLYDQTYFDERNPSTSNVH
uniref:K Homology domain-containing protein n=1 Tax=Acrobeloides nanus TaxID=290746 RepID=A0A914EGB3_9BILA